MNPPSAKKIFSTEFLSISGVIVLLIASLVLGSLIDIDFVNEYVIQAGIWAPVAFVIAKAFTIVLAPLSGTPLYVLVGTLFGVWEGMLYAFIGDFLGLSTLFFISRKYGIATVQHLTKKSNLKLVSTIQTYTNDAWSLAKTYILFFWFPEAVFAAAGLGKMRYITVMLVLMSVYYVVAGLIIILSTMILQ